MKYFKNTELAKLYNVSEKSVRNWVQAAQEGKLDLRLHEEKGKFFIANTARNTFVVESLVAKGKKYKNTRGYKVVNPSPEFYEIYTPKQIVDIMSSLDIYRESPMQYSYFNSGATRWDQYTHHLLEQRVPNNLTNTVQLLELNLGYLDSLFEGYEAINIIDLGVGNALPSRSIIGHFFKRGLLRRYIAVDISKELLSIAEQNVKSWFGGKVKFEGHVRDIAYERFDDLLVAESFGAGTETTANLVLFLGGTLSNFRQPQQVLSTIHDSMGKRDALVFSYKLDTEKSRRYFEMTDRSSTIGFDLVLRLLNIDESLYVLEQYFDEQTMSRYVKARLKVALAIKFQLHGQERVIEFNKDESILLLRMRHQTVVGVIDQFDKNNFELLDASRSKDQEHFVMISKIKSGYGENLA